MNKRLALLALPAVLTIGACAPPPAVHALLQRTACNSTVAPPNPGACVHWINRNPAWGYPADTEWVGPYMDFEYDRGWHGNPLHTNGAELLP